MKTIEDYVASLKVYDPNEKCPVCGFDKIDDLFEPKGTPEPYIAVGQGSFMGEKSYAAIKRTCLRCKNYWETLPLTDKKGE